MADGGEIAQPRATVFGGGMALPAIDGDHMPPRSQARRQFFRKRFESAVSGGNAARPEYGEPHGLFRLPVGQPRALRALAFAVGRGAGRLTGSKENQLEMYSSLTRRRPMLVEQACPHYHEIPPGDR